jgi:hypothetical protein
MPFTSPLSPCSHGWPLLLYSLLLSAFFCLYYSLNSPFHALNKLYSILKKKKKKKRKKKKKPEAGNNPDVPQQRNGFKKCTFIQWSTTQLLENIILSEVT